MPSRRRIVLFAIALLIGAGCGPLDYFDPGPPWVDLTMKKLVGIWQTKKVHLWINDDHTFTTDKPARFGTTARSGTWSLDTPAVNIDHAAVVDLEFIGGHMVQLYAINPDGPTELDYFAKPPYSYTIPAWRPDFRLTKCTKNCRTGKPATG